MSLYQLIPPPTTNHHWVISKWLNYNFHSQYDSEVIIARLRYRGTASRNILANHMFHLLNRGLPNYIPLPIDPPPTSGSSPNDLTLTSASDPFARCPIERLLAQGSSKRLNQICSGLVSTCWSRGSFCQMTPLYQLALHLPLGQQMIWLWLRYPALL